MTDERSSPSGSARAGIVLAGGRASRFGSQKLLTEIDGEPLLWRPLHALGEAGCAEIVVVIGPDASEPALPPELGSIVRLARDPEPFGGPLVGLWAGLAVTSAPRVIVVAGDQPSLPSALLAALAEALETSGRREAAGAAVLVDPTGVARPLPCSLDRATATAAADRLLAGGERSLRRLIAALVTREIPEASWRPLDPLAGWTIDVDLPEDLAQGH